MRLLQSPSAAALPPCNFLLTPKQPFPAALTPISALPSTNPSPFNTWDCPQLLPEPSPASPGSSRLPKLALGIHQVALISPALSVYVSIMHTLLPRCASLLVKPTFAFPIPYFFAPSLLSALAPGFADDLPAYSYLLLPSLPSKDESS